MAFWTRLFGKSKSNVKDTQNTQLQSSGLDTTNTFEISESGKNNVNYTHNTQLQPSGMDNINPFEMWEPLKETMDIVIPIGGSFTYTYNVHGSVGSWWKSEYDNTAFDMQNSRRYLDPERCETMCGADEAIKSETFTALRKGKFKVVINHEFRGQSIYITTINVLVR